ncbi:MAG: alginate export family protein [Lentimicrobiaceae bacterium]|nr:alginate export family protein [Lentimicrobiaceae bacterium]
MKQLLLTFLTLFIFNHAQAQFQMSAELRPRLEFRDGYTSLAADDHHPTLLVSQRSRLSFGYQTEKLRIKITPQDVRIWGDDPKISATGTGNNPSFALFEAYVELALNDAGWLSVGRQMLAYDSKRLLGERNWNQNGLAYDAAVAKLKLSDWNLHFGATWNTLNDLRENNYYPASRIKNLNFIWLNRKLNQINLSLLHISSGKTINDTSNSMNYKNTTGLYSSFSDDRFNLWAHAYYQWGNRGHGGNISALLAEADASMKLDKITLGGGFSYLSGNKNEPAAIGTDHLFDLLYGNRHKYSGEMDYYTKPAAGTDWGGLINGYLYATYKATERLNLSNTLHYFAQARGNHYTKNSQGLGFENDLILNYRLYPQASVQAGYCFYLPTQTLKYVQRNLYSGFSQFFYLQLTVSASFFDKSSR